MPHVAVKLFPGRTEEQKKQLAEKIVQAVTETLHASEASVSVSVEEVPSENWEKEVYRPDILAKESKLYRKPGYSY